MLAAGVSPELNDVAILSSHLRHFDLHSDAVHVLVIDTLNDLYPIPSSFFLVKPQRSENVVISSITNLSVLMLAPSLRSYVPR